MHAMIPIGRSFESLKNIYIYNIGFQRFEKTEPKASNVWLKNKQMF